METCIVDGGNQLMGEGSWLFNHPAVKAAADLLSRLIKFGISEAA